MEAFYSELAQLVEWSSGTKRPEVSSSPEPSYWRTVSWAGGLFLAAAGQPLAHTSAGSRERGV